MPRSKYQPACNRCNQHDGDYAMLPMSCTSFDINKVYVLCIICKNKDEASGSGRCIAGIGNVGSPGTRGAPGHPLTGTQKVQYLKDLIGDTKKNGGTVTFKRK